MPHFVFICWLIPLLSDKVGHFFRDTLYYRTGCFMKSVIFGTTLSLGHHMYHTTDSFRKSVILAPLCQWTTITASFRKSAIFWHHFVIRPLNVLYYSQLFEKSNFGTTLSVGHQMYHTTGCVKKSEIFGTTLSLGHQMYCTTASCLKSAIFGTTLSVCHQTQMYQTTGSFRKSTIFGTTMSVCHQIYCSTGLCLKNAIFYTTLILGHQMYFQEKGNFWQDFVFRPPNVPYYRQLFKKCKFCHHFVSTIFGTTMSVAG